MLWPGEKLANWCRNRNFLILVLATERVAYFSFSTTQRIQILKAWWVNHLNQLCSAKAKICHKQMHLAKATCSTHAYIYVRLVPGIETHYSALQTEQGIFLIFKVHTFASPGRG